MAYIGSAQQQYYVPFEGHRILYLSPKCQRFNQAVYQLLGEDHLRPLARKENSAAIDATVVPGSILLVEGVHAMEKVKPEFQDRVFKLLHISKQAASQLTCYGCDDLNHINEVDNENELTGELPIHKLIVSINQLLLNSELLPEDKKRISIESISAEIRQLEEKIYTGFPKRVEKLITTLCKIEEMRLQGQIVGKIYLITGLEHLKQCSSDPRLSLTSLYQILDTLPAMVAYPAVMDEKVSPFEI